MNFQQLFYNSLAKSVSKKRTRVVKFASLIVITFLLQASVAFAQEVTIKAVNTSLKNVFTEIRRQTGYNVLCTTDILNNAKPISLNLSKIPLADALKQIADQENLVFTIENKSIIIKKKVQNNTPGTPKNPAASSNSITGHVVDTLSKPIPGATVKLSPGRFEVSTDKAGLFVFRDVPPGSYMLTITSIGYQRMQMNLDVNDNEKINYLSFALKESVSTLADVVVTTGYQYIKPEQSTGATVSIGTKEYESTINTDFLSGLVNRLPGLVINNDIKFTSSTYGTTNNGLFNIRGLSTLLGNQNPLIVLDGYPTELAIGDINPNEIKSVTVLKDAAAAAIYGVRAANGVIVIERKRAAIGAPRFAFRSTWSVTPKENYTNYRWAPADTYIKYADITTPSIPWSFYVQYGIPTDPISALVGQRDAGILTQQQMDQQLAALASYNNNKDYSRLFTRNAFTQQYNLDISGGTDKALYYITAGYIGNRLNQIKNNNGQYQLSGRTTLNFTTKFSLDLMTEFLDKTSDSAPVPDISQFYSFEKFQDQQGNPLATYAGSNVLPQYNAARMAQGYLDNMYYPLGDVNQINTHMHTTDNRITANFKYLLGQGFKLSVGGIYESSSTSQRYLASAQSSIVRQAINTYTDASTNPFTYNIPMGDYLQDTQSSFKSYTVRAQLDYNKSLGADHSINAIIGTEVRGEINQLSSAPFFGYSDQTLVSQPVDYAEVLNNSPAITYIYNNYLSYNNLFIQQYTDDRYVSGYFNAVYAYKDKYSLTSSVRIDQSNIFGQDPKYRYKPLWSFGVAWNIEKENFMKNVTWVNALKLRISKGTSGNIAKSSLPQVVASPTLNYVTSPTSTALSLLTPANSGLRWEQTDNFNIGLDYTLFKRIHGSIDYYNKTSKDLLGSAQTDATKGVSSAYINQASIRNEGLELNLHADWISNSKFNWNTGISLSRNTSKVLDVYQSTTYNPGTAPLILTQMATGYMKGYPVGEQFSFRYAGLNNQGYPMVYDPSGKAVLLNSSSNPGMGYFVDEGSYIPVYNIGLSNRWDIGNFYLYVMTNFYGGFKVRVPYPTPDAVRPITGAENFWTKPGDEANPNEVMGSTSGLIYTNYGNTIPYLDKYTVNGAYMTLSNLTASYDIAKAPFIKKLGFTHLELKLQAANVYTIGFNRYNWSQATGSFTKNYLTPTYTVGLFTNF